MFLKEELKEYVRIGSKAYKKCWPSLFQRWKDLWPEQATALPDVPLGQELDEGQNRVLKEAVDKRHKVSSLFSHHWHL